MEITLKYRSICNVIWNKISDTNVRSEKIDKLINIIFSYGLKLKTDDIEKLENFYKIYEKRIKDSDFSVSKFKKKNEDWLNKEIVIVIDDKKGGRPKKDYDEVQNRTKRVKQDECIKTHSANEIKDSFKVVLTRTQPKEAGKIVDVLPTASPKRLTRMIQSITTPKSTTSFTSEDALALVLNLGLTRNKYNILRKALIEKGYDIFPSSKTIRETKENILKPITSPVYATNESSKVELSQLLDNTASRIISTFSSEDIERCKDTEVVLLFKWGCDGTSGFSEYKQPSASNSETKFSSIFMSSLVPLRMRIYSESPSTSSSIDIWRNLTPGSKFLCRPIRFEYVKEDKITTQSLVHSIENEISSLSPVFVEINGQVIKVSFQGQFTMIDGKVANAVTDTTSTWKCNICGKISSQFHQDSDSTCVNENALKFGISPLHARIRFMEYCLHLAYDLKYRVIPGQEKTPVKNNAELSNMRKEEKKRIQDEFKMQLGLIVDRPLQGYGSSNDGNTARRFFEDPETTSSITGIDENLLKRFKIILSVINSKKPINVAKFQVFANETKKNIMDLYPWRSMTPTVHKVLAHGKEIIEYSMLPLGELTEEAQEARNSDVKNFRLFNTRKCSKIAQNSDLMEYLLISSDPVLYSIRTKWLPKISMEIEKEDSEAMDIKDLLTFDITDYFIENT